MELSHGPFRRPRAARTPERPSPLGTRLGAGWPCAQLQPLPQEFADGLVLQRNLVWKSLEKPEPGCFLEQVRPGTQAG